MYYYSSCWSIVVVDNTLWLPNIVHSLLRPLFSSSVTVGILPDSTRFVVLDCIQYDVLVASYVAEKWKIVTKWKDTNPYHRDFELKLVGLHQRLCQFEHLVDAQGLKFTQEGATHLLAYLSVPYDQPRVHRRHPHATCVTPLCQHQSSVECTGVCSARLVVKGVEGILQLKFAFEQYGNLGLINRALPVQCDANCY